MSNPLFREKSLKRISSPEQLNEYIRVSNPSVWLLLIAVLLLLAGVCIWGVTGSLDTVVSAAAVAREGKVTAYVQDEQISRLEVGMRASIGESEGSVAEIGTHPVQVDASFGEYALHVGGLQAGQWVYEVTLDVPCADGVHRAEIITESVPPISFVMN